MATSTNPLPHNSLLFFSSLWGGSKCPSVRPCVRPLRELIGKLIGNMIWRCFGIKFTSNSRPTQQFLSYCIFATTFRDFRDHFSRFCTVIPHLQPPHPPYIHISMLSRPQAPTLAILCPELAMISSYRDVREIYLRLCAFSRPHLTISILFIDFPLYSHDVSE